MTMQTFTEKDVARILKCSVAGLRKMRRERRGPRWIRVGRLIRYPEESLQELLAEQGNPQRNGSQ